MYNYNYLRLFCVVALYRFSFFMYTERIILYWILCLTQLGNIKTLRYSVLIRRKKTFCSLVLVISTGFNIKKNYYMACVCGQYNARSDWLIVTDM